MYSARAENCPSAHEREIKFILVNRRQGGRFAEQGHGHGRTELPGTRGRSIGGDGALRTPLVSLVWLAGRRLVDSGRRPGAGAVFEPSAQSSRAALASALGA
jgi:hypothetical protein